ncbi:interleukin-1 family member 10-like isoform X3 [Pelodiscus sinensis]|uniref:interleukin-1 family member 10-like isoform X3 n=1 Tax=Pelodiscus sinensis TaxID=13735 RepID=UPI003F6B6C12
MVAPLLALLLTCCSCPCFSSQSRTDNGIRATSPLREGAAEEDSFPSQAPETSTDVGMGSSRPAPPQDTAGTEPWPGAGPRPDSWAQPSNRDLVELFDEFLNQKQQFIPSVPKHSLFTLRDTNQRVIRRLHKQLVATPQTSNAPPEKISVVPNQFLDPSNFPIIMGIDNGTRCLSCGTSAPPTLMLEDKEIMALYQNSQEAKRFTFTCVATGSTRRFESVAFPGWFLSTSPKDGQPVRVTNISGEAEIVNFYFKKM